MGLFDIFKGKKPAEQAVVPPPIPSQGPTVAVRWDSTTGDAGDAGDEPITLLSEAADPADRPTWDALWKAVFNLPAWHFISQKMPEGDPRPVTSTINGRSSVIIYTSKKRATSARAHFAQAIPDAEVTVLSLPVTDAAEYVCSLRQSSAVAVHFNQGTNGRGFNETLTSVAMMIEYFTDTLPAGCFARFIQAGNQMQQSEIWRRLKIHLARLPRWYFLTDPERRDLPQLIETDGEQRTTVYSGEHEAMIAVAAMGGGTPGNIPALLEVSPKDGAAMLAKVVELSGSRVTEVVLNFGSEGVALGIDSVIEAVGEC